MSQVDIYLVAATLITFFVLVIWPKPKKTPKYAVKRTTRDVHNGHLETRVLFVNGQVAIYRGTYAYSTNFHELKPIKVFTPKQPVIGHVPRD